MRLACAHCEGFQPPEWQPGDACIHCGRIARPESLCFWCVEWVPAGKFCRSCGAAVVARSHYGAARMLKDAGVDRFRIPEMLGEMDPDQRENLDRIYQRQAAMVARHVDDTAFLEEHLFQKTFAAEVELELLRRLPLPPADANAFSGSAPPAGETPRQRAKRIADTAPALLSRTLASIVLLRLDDWNAIWEVTGLATHPNPRVRTEAALALTSWRVVYGLPDGFDRRKIPTAVWEELQQSPFQHAATVRLALWDNTIEVHPHAMHSADPDISMTAALARGNVDRLTLALDSNDALAQRAAGMTLVRLNCFAPLRRLLQWPADDHVLDEVLTLASHKRYQPVQLRNELFELVESHPNQRVRQRAASVLANACQPFDGLRFIRAAGKDSRIRQSVLQSSALDVESLEEVCVYLIENGGFTMEQFGMSTLAEKGMLPMRFVPQHFAKATDDRTRIELCRFAEHQLINGPADEALHHFLVNVVYGPDSVPELRGEAWWCLRRWYLRSDPRGESPVALAVEPCTRFFRSPESFVLRLTTIFHERESVSHLGLSEDLERILREAQLEALIAAGERPVLRLAEAVVSVMRSNKAAFTLRTTGAAFLAVMAQHPEWRERAHAMLNSFRGTDIDYAASQAQQRC